MLHKTIKYTNLLGQKKTRKFTFNLSKVELTQMNLAEKGGLKAGLERFIEEENQEKATAWLKDTILKAYGEISLDGETFKKSPEATLAFEQSPAFEELFFELMTDPEAMKEFFNGIIPEVPDPKPNFDGK
jgi:hypothetical protein